MPRGIASVVGDNGDIYGDPPEPVGFIVSRHEGVSDGMDVYFERRADKPLKARTVRPWTTADTLAAPTLQSAEFTHPARKRLLEMAEQLSARIEPPSGCTADLTISEAQNLMEAIAARLPEQAGQVGIKAVRNAIDRS